MPSGSKLQPSRTGRQAHSTPPTLAQRSVQSPLSGEYPHDFVSELRSPVYKPTRAVHAPASPPFSPVLGLVTLAALLAACAAEPAVNTIAQPAPTTTVAPAPTAREPLAPGLTATRPRDRRLYALPGQPLLFPLDTPPQTAVPPDDRFAITPAVALPVSIARLGVIFDQPTPSPLPRAASWVGRPGLWRSSPRGDANPRAFDLSTWVAVATPEAVAAALRGRGLRNLSPVGEIDAPLTLLTDDPAPGSALLNQAAREALADDADTAALEAMLDPLLSSPRERWRAQPLRRALERPAAAPTTNLGRVRVQRPVRAADELVDTLAAQTSARWHIGLARLNTLDAPLALDLARRLMGLLRLTTTDAAIIVPAWPPDDAALAALLDDLLDPELADARRVERARAFIAEQPRALAWVIDDAGQSEAITGRPIATIAVANLGTSPALAGARPADAGRATDEDLRPLAPRSAAALTVAVPVAPPAAPGATAADPTSAARRALTGVDILARPGSPATRLRVLAEPAPVFPPGLRLQPLYADWSMPTWRRASAVNPPEADAPFATAALLSAVDTAPDAPRAWQLLVECAAPDSDVSTTDSVRLWLGPFNRPVAVLLATPDGRLIDQTADARAGRPLATADNNDSNDTASNKNTTNVRVAKQPGRWFVWIPIPAAAIEADGKLRLALERLDPRGVRTTWPRPSLPWQPEPGRAAADLTAWSPR